MEFYVVLLLVAAAFADSDKYYHIAPQTHLIHNQQIPLYQTVQTPTYYKLDDDVDVDDDDNKYLYTFPQTHQVTPVQYSHINTQLPVQPVQYSQFHTLVKPVKHIRNTRSAESTEVEVKKTDSHFLNLLTTKPETTPLMQHFKSSGHLFQQTPVINTHFQKIQPYQIKLDGSLESVEVDASKAGLIHPVFTQKSGLIQNVLPVQTQFIQNPIFRTLATPMVQKPVSQVGTHLVHQTKQVLPPVHTEAIEVVAPKTNLINPVFTQKSGLIQTPIYTQYMQKKLDVEDIINPVQYTTIPQLYNQYPLHMVQQPIYKQMDTQMIQPGYVLAHQGALLHKVGEESDEDAIEVSH